MSAGNVGEIVAQLKDAIERIDKAAVAAARMQKDAGEAHGAFSQAGKGSEHPKIRQAITETAEAQAKAGKLARLYAEAANAFADYINVISPGGAPAGRSSAGGYPTGDAIVEDANARQRGFGKAARKVTENAESVGDGLKKVYEVVKAKNPGGTTTTGEPSQPAASNPPQGLTGDAVSAIAITSAAVVAAVLKAIDPDKKKRKDDDD